MASCWIVFILSSCTVTPLGPDESQLALEQAARLASQGDREGAAEIYWNQANSSKSPQREELQLQAIESVLTPKTLALARQYLDSLDETRFQGTLLVRKRLADAEMAMLEGKPSFALTVLPSALDSLAPSLMPSIQQLRARAFAAQGQILPSVKIRIALEDQLTDSAAVIANRQAIWESLASIDAAQLYQWAQMTSERSLKGWLELAYISQTASAELANLKQELTAWQQRFPDHPATSEMVTLIIKDWHTLQMRVDKIAIILPLSGKYTSISQAIMDGFMSAYYLDGVKENKPILQVYDLGERPNAILSTYRRAVREGADLIVGPLDKQAVTELMRHSDLPIPVLSLNYGSDSIAPPVNFYQFGLLPEDEARQVAERASVGGYERAIVFAPIGKWGTRISEAFTRRFEELGGTVLIAEKYEPRGTDFSLPIKQALLLNESEQRRRNLENTLRTDVNFKPYRRRDVEVVFIAASPRQARLLRPQLEFHYASNLPIYATSHIYSGIPDVNANRDINGIIFCDMPWILNPKNPNLEARGRIEQLFQTSSRRLPRFIALGIDAYRVIPYLKRLAARRYERHAGLTGTLSVTDSRRIYRTLDWAQFVNGMPKIIDGLAPSKLERDMPR